MGIKIFYIFAIIYGIISSLGVFAKYLPSQFLYIFLIAITGYYFFYTNIKKRLFLYAIFGGIIVNLSVQLTGGLNSPLFFIYPIILLLIGLEEHYLHYWTIAICLFAAEIISAIISHNVLILPLILFAATIVIFGIIMKKRTDTEESLKRALTKYESRDDFFAPADFEHDTIVTSIREIDQHPGIERPLLYFVKFLHTIFNAQTTAIFSHSSSNLVLIQGFSHSELFRPDTVVNLETGLYRQAISEQKSVLIKKFKQKPEELGYYKGEAKISSALVAPILLRDCVEGILVIDKKKGQFSEEDKKVFDDAANAVGYLLATLRLYEKEKYETLYLNAIGEVAKELQKELDLKLILVNAIKSFKMFMKCDDISVAKIDEINNNGIVIASTYIKENTKFTLDDSLVGFIGKHKNAIIKDNLHEGNLVVLKKGEKTRNTSFVGVPIKQDNELLGVIWLEDHRKKKFNKDDLEPLYILSSQLSLAWQRAKLYYKVKDLVILDGLTELYNHRHFQETLEDEIDKSKELVLMMIDIDHFKRINDAYGHLTGDEVLKVLGKIIKNYGIAARYGGEEFTIILPKHSLEKGLKSAYTLKAQIKNAEIKINKNKISITVSIGVAHYPKDASTKVELIAKADTALYIAKEKGRDKVVAAQTVGKNQKSR